MTSRKASLRAARHTTRELGQLFARLGSAKHPRGAVLVAYRNARRAMRDVLRRNTSMASFEAREIMAELQWRIREIAAESLDNARELGERQAAIEARLWGLNYHRLALAADNNDEPAMLEAWVGVVEQQERAILATIATGDPAAILGSATAVGLLRPSPVTREGSKWLTAAVGVALLSILSPALRATGYTWGKQALASIDERTSPCCLAVHGQVVPLEQKFYTPDSPAYADWQEWSPFHDYCRTSIVLVPLSEAQDNLTAEMLTCAREEQARRAEEKK